MNETENDIQTPYMNFGNSFMGVKSDGPLKMVKSRNPIKTDKVRLSDYQRFNYASSCEECTHFDHSDEKCTFGYPTAPHLKRNQLAQLLASGEMAFCRAMEID